MTFGQIIKKLRHDAEMTQEQLAELVSISPQAVSRWETDAAMPDISLLPPLANLFHVTTDYLLGMDTYQKDLRRAEFDEAFHEYWRKDDKEKNYRIARRAVLEYPGDMEYLEWLASAEYYVAFLRSDTEYRALLGMSAKHYKTVFENCTEQKLKDKALFGIVISLHYNEKNDEAKEYAMLQEDETKRDELLNVCLTGQEKKKHSQKVLSRKLDDLLRQIPIGQPCMEAYDAIERVVEIMFPDGNYLHHHNTMQYNYIHKAFCLCRRKEYDAVMEELKKARYHAEEMTKFSRQKTYQYTAKLFDCLDGENVLPELKETDVEDFIRSLENNSCFDPLRDREDFKALLQK